LSFGDEISSLWLLDYLLFPPVRFIIIKTMKQCPNCQTTYADDSLQFCLQDGTPLAQVPNQDSADYFDSESATVVSPKKVEPLRFEPPSSYQPTNQPNWEPNQPVILEQRQKKKSNTVTIVVLSVLGTILLLGLGGLGALLYFSNKKTQVAAGINTAPQNRSPNATPTNQNTTTNLATPSPTVTPTAQPTIKPEVVKAISNDVKNVVDDWKNATENLDLDTHLSQYADTVDYYRGGKVGIAKVRADKEQAYSAYDSIDINITNMKITPDASGEKATALFDKEWNFEGEGKSSSGKVQQQLMLSKVNGKWLITGEKDLKVYYTQN
jgi:hypothetical protein